MGGVGMREIKFRAWDKSTKLYFPIGEIHFCRGGIKVFGPGIYIGNGWATEENGYRHNCDVILEQFTGLHDKNGKEAFENDRCDYIYTISQSGNHDETTFLLSGKGTIKMIEGCFMICADTETAIPMHYPDLSFEIIGNIHKEATND
jgi:uncharacterized phage protein (TIGR01671 family)